MGRPVVLSNGRLMVGLNEQGMVHDFYYPYVGLDNLSNARSLHHKVGIWVDDKFTWLDDDSWNTTVDFDNDALISTVIASHPESKVQLTFRDFVDSEYNFLGRQISILNQAENEREIRLFMHQVFQISRAGRADTALFEPDNSYILDYKGRVSLLIYAQTAEDQQPFDQYSVGSYGIEDKEGTFRDAEDGVLEGNAVEHGGVDSVVRLRLKIPANTSSDVDYWVAAAASQQDAEKIHHIIKEQGLSERMRLTHHHWREWLAIGADGLDEVEEKYLPAVKKSLMVIKAHADQRGGILASGDSSIFNYGRDYYCYCWPRDGAYAIWPLIRLGYKDEPRLFFEFCRDVLHEDGYLQHKYQPDRAIGSTWHPLIHNNHKELAIQEDETAIVLFMLGEYLETSKDDDFVRNLYGTLIHPAANFMSAFIDDITNLPHASYDLWEEKFLTSTYTAYITQAGLRVAARLADNFEYPDDAIAWKAAAERITDHLPTLFSAESNYFIKGQLLNRDGQITPDTTLDASSMYAAMMFGTGADPEHLKATVKALEDQLLAKGPAGGMPRYLDDNYMRTDPSSPGNPWFICNLWLAQYYVLEKDFAKAASIVDWTLAKALPSGVLAEQIDPKTGDPVGVAPLVWSHAELVNTILDIST